MEWFNNLTDAWSLRTIYMACSILGGSVMTLQILLLMIGGHDMDADTDVDVGHDGDLFGFFSIRAVAAFLTFFGLSGMWGMAEGWGSGRTISVALGAGVGMMLVVVWVMSLQSKLYSEGNLDPENAVGQNAKVYLRIPGENSGKGKITVSIQGRSQEYEAVTSGPQLPTGSSVRVMRQTTPNTFEVEAL